MFIRLRNKLGLCKGVYLKSYNGQVYESEAIEDPWGVMHASVYPGIGDCILLPNGIVDPKSESSYISFWKPMTKPTIKIKR